jgi:signal transduction histidine kinase
VDVSKSNDQRQRMEALARMAGGVAHEFNNVLTVILGYSDLLTETLADDDGMRPIITDIAKAARRGQRISRDLMLFSGWQPLQPQPVSIAEEMNALSRTLHALLPPQISVELDVPDPSLRVVCDPDRFSELLTNLAAHGGQAMQRGGTLRIEASRVHVAQLVDATGVRPVRGDYAMIRVRDSGAGMDAVTRERLFEPFFTTRKREKGAGLQMAVVFGIVKACGGFVTVQSAVGEGSTIDVYLPVAAQSAEDGAPFVGSVPVWPCPG